MIAYALRRTAGGVVTSQKLRCRSVIASFLSLLRLVREKKLGVTSD
jgi:hypothetical protein